MKYTVECFELGFICESLIESEDRGEVLELVLEHLDESHSVGVNSSGFKDFIGRHIKQVDDEAASDAASWQFGTRRGPRSTVDLTTWISDRLRRRGGQHTHEEERTK